MRFDEANYGSEIHRAVRRGSPAESVQCARSLHFGYFDCRKQHVIESAYDRRFGQLFCGRYLVVERVHPALDHRWTWEHEGFRYSVLGIDFSYKTLDIKPTGLFLSDHF